jgi:hypothetical protein
MISALLFDTEQGPVGHSGSLAYAGQTGRDRHITVAYTSNKSALTRDTNAEGYSVLPTPTLADRTCLRRDCTVGNPTLVGLHNGLSCKPACVLRRSRAEKLYRRRRSLGNFAADDQQARNALGAASRHSPSQPDPMASDTYEDWRTLFRENTAATYEAGRSRSSCPEGG